MDIFSLIQEDHQKVRELFQQLKSGSGNRDQLFSQLKEELELHTHAEEQVFYPVLQEVDVTQDMMEEAIGDHELVEELLEELATAPKDTEEWSEKLDVLQENVEEHVEEEESDIFEAARQILVGDQAQELAQRWQTAKQEQLARYAK